MVEHRLRAVLEVRNGSPVTEVAARYGASRQSVYGWKTRYERDGIGGLTDPWSAGDSPVDSDNSYLVNAHWSSEASYTLVQAFDPALGIAWPIGESAAIRSDKDRGHLLLADTTPIEV